MKLLNGEIVYHIFWIIPLAFLVFYYAKKRRINILEKLLGPRLNSSDYISLSATKRNIKFICFISFISFLILACARPSWGEHIMPFSSKGRDVMILLDVSKSMLSDDIKPSRLKHSKWFIKKVINQNKGDRFGLIAFSGASFLNCPLTQDKTSFFQILNELDSSSIPVGGTNIELALEKALEAFKSSSGMHRAVLLITDGDELDGDSSNVLKEFKSEKIPLFVVGIGNPNKPGLIRLPDETGKMKFLRDGKGELVKSKLNYKQLSNLAKKTNGLYTNSNIVNSGVGMILKEIHQLVPKEFDKGKQVKPIERFMYPLIIAFIFFIAFIIISEKKKIYKKATILLIISAQFAIMNLNADVKPIETFNKALDLQKKNDDKFIKLYEEAINAPDSTDKVKAKAYLNLGVYHHNIARKKLSEKNEKLIEEPEKSIENLKKLEDDFNKSEELYCLSMQYGDEKELNVNQTNLLSDKQQVTQTIDLMKLFIQLKKDAISATQAAKKIPVDNPNVKNNLTKIAKLAVKKYANIAKILKIDKLSKSIDAANNELEKSLTAQVANKDTHIKKALEYLGVKDNEDKKNNKNKDDKNKDDKNKDDKNKDDKKDNEKQKKQDKKSEEQKQKDKKQDGGKNDKLKKQNPKQDKKQVKKEAKKIDPRQAEAILNSMANGEKKLRDELKKQMIEKTRNRYIEKDW